MIRIKFQKTKLVIGAGFEYEDVLTLLVAKTLPESFNDEFKVDGKIISGSNFTEVLQDLGLDLTATEKKEKDTKRVQNYVCNINSKSPVLMTRKMLIELVEKLHSTCYLLLNFTIYLCSECSSHMVMNPTKKVYICKSCGMEQKKPKVEFSVHTKGNPPRPTTKQKGVPKSESDKVSSKIKFSQTVLPNTEKTKNELLSEITPDFLDEIPTKVNLIEVVNNYHISNLVLPSKELMKNSKLFRQLTIREGSLERILKVDKNSFENVIQFRV